MLFDGSYTVITEFGRSIVAKAGMLVSRVEYTKMAGGRFIIQQHCGHDLLVRTVWCPQVWPLRLLVFNGVDGNLRTGDPIVSDVAGTSTLSPLYVLSSSYKHLQGHAALPVTWPQEKSRCPVPTKAISSRY